jgi:ABC-type nickel/cobalt efflux system permease component RcnA
MRAMRSARKRPAIEPGVIRTIGTGLLAAFTVVLVVSVTTIGWHGTDAYVLIMLTLVASLLVLTTAAVLTGRLLARMRSRTKDRSPSSELKRLRDEVLTLRQKLDELHGQAAKAEPAKQPDQTAEP